MKERGIVLLAIAIVAMLAASNAGAATLGNEQHCLALSLYFEARGEGREGMVAVGWTILNRVESRDFPPTTCEVVRQGGERPPCQFSWWCDGRSDRPRERDSWNLAMRIAGELLFDPPPDPTGGSLYFHATHVDPYWRQAMVRTARVGSHVFYRER